MTEIGIVKNKITVINNSIFVLNNVFNKHGYNTLYYIITDPTVVTQKDITRLIHDLDWLYVSETDDTEEIYMTYISVREQLVDFRNYLRTVDRKQQKNK